MVSLAAYLGAVAVAVLSAATNALAPIARRTALLVFAFLSLHLFQSAVVTNDVLLLPFSVLVFSLLMSALQGRRPATDLTLGLVLATAVATKTSFIFPAVAAVLTLLVSGIRGGQNREALTSTAIRAAAPPIIVLLLCCLRSYVHTGWLLYLNSWLLSSEQYVGNTPERFLTFSLSPFYSAVTMYSPAVVRALWSAVYVSLFSADYSFPGLPADPFLPLRCTALLLAGFFVTGCAVRAPQRAPAAALIALCLLSFVAFTVNYPFSSTQSARLLLPVAFPVTVLLGIGAQYWWERGRAGRLLVQLAALLNGLAIVYGYGLLLFV